MISDHNKVAVLMLKPECNMHCEYCVIEDDFSSFPYEVACELAIKLKAEGYNNLILGGGEPTLWRGDVFKLAHFSKSLGFFVQIGTNAIRLPLDFASNTDIDRWILPLDSSHEEIHNQLRHYKSSHFQIMMNVLGQLKKNKRDVYISTVVTSINKTSLDDMINFLNEYNCENKNLISWNLYQLLPLGRGGLVNWDTLKITTEEFDSIVAKLKSRDRNFKITVRKNMYASKNVDFFTYKDDAMNLNEKFYVKK